MEATASALKKVATGSGPSSWQRGCWRGDMVGRRCVCWGVHAEGLWVVEVSKGASLRSDLAGRWSRGRNQPEGLPAPSASPPPLDGGVGAGRGREGGHLPCLQGGDLLGWAPGGRTTSTESQLLTQKLVSPPTEGRAGGPRSLGGVSEWEGIPER